MVHMIRSLVPMPGDRSGALEIIPHKVRQSTSGSASGPGMKWTTMETRWFRLNDSQ